ncbi:MAG TPA: hypothetical protein VM285_02285 [Polyangia bacterium]|nr:hypothetical protein [Polyangia bacterium]
MKNLLHSIVAVVLFSVALLAGVHSGSHNGHGKTVDITVTPSTFDYKISADGGQQTTATPDIGPAGGVESSGNFYSPSGDKFRVENGKLQWFDGVTWWSMSPALSGVIMVSTDESIVSLP